MAKDKIRYSFYRPHARVQYTGEVFNHKTGEFFIPPTRTKQQFLEQCDVNNIVKSFTKRGQLDQLAALAATGKYLDLPEAIEFQDSMNLVIAAEQAFDALPSKVRSRFANDPAQFLAFMSDPGNQDEAIKLGLATRRPEPTPPKKADPPPTETAPKSPPDPTGGAGGKPPAEGAKAP